MPRNAAILPRAATPGESGNFSESGCPALRLHPTHVCSGLGGGGGSDGAVQPFAISVGAPLRDGESHTAVMVTRVGIRNAANTRIQRTVRSDKLGPPVTSPAPT